MDIESGLEPIKYIAGVHLEGASTESSFSLRGAGQLPYASATLKREVVLICDQSCDFERLREFTNGIVGSRLSVEYQFFHEPRIIISARAVPVQAMCRVLISYNIKI